MPGMSEALQGSPCGCKREKGEQQEEARADRGRAEQAGPHGLQAGLGLLL